MRKTFLSVILFMLASVAALAKVPVTLFMGVPVDGLEKDMILTFQAKGFEFFPEERTLYGSFNGTNVSVQMEINENTNMIYSLYVCERNLMDEAGIKSRYNQLVSQFQKDKRYRTMADYTISDNVKISDEIRKGEDRFKAVFYQVDDENQSADSVDIKMLQKREVRFNINGYGGKYFIVMNFDNGYNYPDE